MKGIERVQSKKNTSFPRSRVVHRSKHIEVRLRGGTRAYNLTCFGMTSPCLQHGVPVPAARYMPPETSWRRVAACVEVAVGDARKNGLFVNAD